MKLTQYWKSTILQFKKKTKKENQHLYAAPEPNTAHGKNSMKAVKLKKKKKNLYFFEMDHLKS